MCSGAVGYANTTSRTSTSPRTDGSVAPLSSKGSIADWRSVASKYTLAAMSAVGTSITWTAAVMTTITEANIIKGGICVPVKSVSPIEKRYWPYQNMKPMINIIEALPRATAMPFTMPCLSSDCITASTPLQ